MDLPESKRATINRTLPDLGLESLKRVKYFRKMKTLNYSPELLLVVPARLLKRVMITIKVHSKSEAKETKNKSRTILNQRGIQ